MKGTPRQLWLKWSETKLKQLIQCPLAFQFTYIDKQVVPQGIEKVFGTVIHYMLARYFVPKHGYKSFNAFFKAFSHFWNNVIGGLHGPYSYHDPPIKIRTRQKNVNDYFGLGHDLLRAFDDENRPYIDGVYPRPLATEARIVTKYQGFWLNGMIDRIQQTPEGIIIYDYKTGFSNQGDIELKHDLQFTIYSLLYLKKYGQLPDKLMLWYLRTDGSKLIEVPSRSQQQYHELVCLIEEASHFVQSAMMVGSKTCLFAQNTYRYFCLPQFGQQTFNRRIGPHCRYCDFDYLCLECNIADSFRERLVDLELSRIQPQIQVVQLSFPDLVIPKTKPQKK